MTFIKIPITMPEHINTPTPEQERKIKEFEKLTEIVIKKLNNGEITERDIERVMKKFSKKY